MSEGSAQSGSKAVKVAGLGRKRFENIEAVDGSEVAATQQKHSRYGPSRFRSVSATS